jgi:Mg-chelatase subunit ChlD
MSNADSVSFAHLLGALFMLGVGVAACAAPSDDDSAASKPSKTGTNGVQGTAGNASSGSGSAGTSSVQLGDVTLEPVPISNDGGEVSACQAETREAKRVPVDMYFLVDSSGSMAEQATGGSKWQVVSKALISFLNDPLNTDTAVGVGYFPTGGGATACTAGQPGCVCIPFTPLCYSNTGGSCTPADYRPAVGLSLPASVAPVVTNISSHQLSGGTPTRPALEGTLKYLEEWAASHPDRKTVLVLATDGEPTGCTTNTPQDIATLAGNAWTGAHAIRTFVIGVGGSLSSLNVVAQAGGTDQVLQVDASGNLGMEFIAALEKIRTDSTVSCDFVIPAAGADGKAVDPSKVNVRTTAAGATSSTLVGQAFMNDPANCGAEGGWYYDDPTAPTQIKLCEATCQTIRSGSIELEFGCDTVVRPPR